jgi:hypothetical protein
MADNLPKMVCSRRDEVIFDDVRGGVKRIWKLGTPEIR